MGTVMLGGNKLRSEVFMLTNHSKNYSIDFLIKLASLSKSEHAQKSRLKPNVR